MNKQCTQEITQANNYVNYQSAERSQNNIAFDVVNQSNSRQLIWSSHRPNDWEILVYNNGASWEACFFRWPIHHEHANGPSFSFVRQRAEQRIRGLEANGLR